MLMLPTLLLVAAVSGASARPGSLGTRDTGLAGIAIDAKISLPRLANVVSADRARAAWLIDRGHRKSQHQGSKRQSASISASNTAVDFTAQVKIGDPATEYTLLVDSGSSNTWVGAKQAYSASSTSHNTGRSVSVTYGSGSFSGTEYTDKVDLGSGLVVNSQSIGVANKTSGFNGEFDGIWGIGPTDLTQGSLSGSYDSIPTVADNLYSQKTIGANVIGLLLPPYSANAAGSLSFGGVDSSKYTGDLKYTPITKQSPASQYWGVDQSVSYGSTTILSSTSGIVDSGTTMIMLATDAYNAYQQATGATADDKTGMLKLPASQYSNLQPLKFTIGGVDYTLNANAQIWPRSLNTALGGDNDSVYLVVGDLGGKSGSGFDFINGYLFMERFYTVFDATHSQVGFATTQYTDSTSN